MTENEKRPSYTLTWRVHLATTGSYPWTEDVTGNYYTDSPHEDFGLGDGWVTFRQYTAAGVAQPVASFPSEKVLAIVAVPPADAPPASLTDRKHAQATPDYAGAWGTTSTTDDDLPPF